MNRIVSFCNRCRGSKYYKNPFLVKNINKFEMLADNYISFIIKECGEEIVTFINNPFNLQGGNRFFYESFAEEYPEEYKACCFLNTFVNPKLVNSKQVNYVNKFFDLFLSLPKEEFSTFFC